MRGPWHAAAPRRLTLVADQLGQVDKGVLQLVGQLVEQVGDLARMTGRGEGGADARCKRQRRVRRVRSCHASDALKRAAHL